MKPDLSLSATPGHNLLHRLRNANGLAGYLQRMPAPRLIRLVAEVGLEDSAELLQHIDARQMNELLDVALWRPTTTGGPELPDAAAFMRWLDVWLDDGEQTLARRLVEMDQDLLATLVVQLIDVGSVDSEYDGHSASDTQFGAMHVRFRSEMHGPALEQALAVLWQQEPDFLTRLLACCEAQQNATQAFEPEVAQRAPGSAFMEDVAFERIVQRSAQGYVTPMNASMFLIGARRQSLQALLDETAHDADTADYLARRESAPAPVAIASPEDDEPALLGSPKRAASDESAPHPQDAAFQDADVLDALLRDAGVFHEPVPSARSLPAPSMQQAPSSSSSRLLEEALAGFAAQARTELVFRRWSELAYLANAVMANTRVQGSAFDEAGASRFAMDTANLGATWVLRGTPPAELDARLHDLLKHDPGIVRLFRIGYHLLGRIHAQCAEVALQIVVPREVDLWHTHPDLEEDPIDMPDLASLVREGRFDDARTCVEDGFMVMDYAAGVAFNILVDDTPCFPNLLDARQGPGRTHVDQGFRYISTVAELDAIAHFLQSLPRHLAAR